MLEAEPAAASTPKFKYRLAYPMEGVCVLRDDNEVGKGDHRHFNHRHFIARGNRENLKA